MIGDSTSWELIPRENKASDLPSDFALINVRIFYNFFLDYLFISPIWN